MDDTRKITHKFRLRPREGQAKRMRQWCNAARYVWNFSLGEYESALDESRALRKDVTPDQKTPSVRDLLEQRMTSLGLVVMERKGDKERTMPLVSILYALWRGHRDTQAPQWVREAVVAKLGGHCHVASYPIERLKDTVNRWWKAKRRAPWITSSERKAGVKKKKRRKPEADTGSDGLLVGAPRYKRHGANPSFTIQAGKGRLAYAKGAILLPVLGRVYVDDRRDQNPMDLHPDTVVKLFTVREVAGEWEVSLSVQEPWDVPGPHENYLACGIDLGIKAEATVAWSDGRVERFEPPRPLQRLGVGIQLLQRKLDTSKHVLHCVDCGEEYPLKLKKRFNRIRKCRACDGRLRRWRSKRGMALNLRISKLHARIARIRLDHLHKLSHKILGEATAICTEPHNVTGLVSEGVAKSCAKLWNKGIARKETRKAMLDIGWGELRRQLGYKAKWLGLDYVTLPEGTASDKTCWCCGERNEVPDNTSDYVCTHCGWSGDRQENTALLCLDYVHKIPGDSPGGRAVTRQQDAETARLKLLLQDGDRASMKAWTTLTPGASAPGVSRKKARKTGSSPRRTARASSGSQKPPPLAASGSGDGPLQQ
jgi:putative transposase